MGANIYPKNFKFPLRKLGVGQIQEPFIGYYDTGRQESSDL